MGLCRLHRRLSRSGLVLLQIAKVVVDTGSIRRSRDFAYVQRVRLPRHVEHALTGNR